MNTHRVIAFAILLSGIAIAQQPALKPEPSAPAATVEAAKLPANTSRYWRLMSEALGAREQANQTPQGKAAITAEALVQQEGASLARECSEKFGEKYTATIDQDPKSTTFKDVICYVPPALAK